MQQIWNGLKEISIIKTLIIIIKLCKTNSIYLNRNGY